MKATKIFFVLFVIILSVSTVIIAVRLSSKSTVSTPKIPGWTRYENKELDFSLEYPEGATKQEENASYIRFQNYPSSDWHVLQVGEWYLEILILNASQTCQDLLMDFSIVHLGNQDGYRGFAKPAADPNARIPSACAQKNGRTILFQVTEGSSLTTTAEKILNSISFYPNQGVK